MATKRTTTPARVFTDQELEQVARELVERMPGLASSDFKKVLAADYKKEEKRVVQAATALAARRELYRFTSGKKARFFLRDPFNDLVLAVKDAVADGPLREADLKYRVESIHRGYADLLKGWMKGALLRAELFVHRPAKGSTLKRFGVTPDMGVLLKKVVAELKKVLGTPAGRSISTPQLFASLAAEVGFPSVLPSATPVTEQQQFMAKLNELTQASKPGSLLSVRDLRAQLPFEKAEFDRIALELATSERVILHYHDFPASLSESARAELIVDSRGNHFIGIAPRR
ncbi:MAG TPA: hypothetical protein VKP30_22665 [Polyangiaceae bacterium]|nr:hypothetical protein [Polyangiaceae bacterium]